MASFTAAGHNTTLSLRNKGEIAAIALSGTYAATVELQREKGSPGSGAWEAIKSWNTANATVAYNYVASQDAERLRIICVAFTSGTEVSTITLTGNQVIHEWTDKQGNLLMRLTQYGLELVGVLRRRTSGAVIGGPSYQITASVTLDPQTHAGRTGLFNVAGGATVTLPAATGTGNKYPIYVMTTLTSSGIIKVSASPGTDIIQGGVGISTDIAGVSCLTIPTADTITMNGSTTGGLKGSLVELEDVSTGLWAVRGFLVSTGTEDTPFTATVP